MNRMSTMEFAAPIPTRASKAAIHGFAEQLASKLGFGRNEPIISLVARIGGKIEYKNPVSQDGRLPESIIVRKLNDFTIFVPSITSSVRDRFTVAHELGHYYLHFTLVSRATPGASMRATRWVNPTDQIQQRAEWEANWFAAAFLMPSKEFRAVFKQRDGILGEVASLFGVSSQAAEIRANNLHLI